MRLTARVAGTGEKEASIVLVEK